jgi:dihydroxyacetone kinase DhaKLM complex PTS-EIIA-like component DhaM
MGKNVGIVIVSHSPDVAKGAADMVRQMVGANVPLAWCGGNPAGWPRHQRRGDREGTRARVVGCRVVIMVDMGGAETNSEMAIELMPEKRRAKIVVCNGPIVEGAVMAANESSSGATLDRVRRAAEELYSR